MQLNLLHGTRKFAKKISLSFSARDVWSSRLLCMTNDKPELRAAFLISAANMQQKHDILEQSRGS